MPELPEVETTMRGIEPHVCGQTIHRVIVRNHRLRWPVAPETADMAGRVIQTVSRRAKYILMQLDHGSLIWHLGMSGSMAIQPINTPPKIHEHIEIELTSGQSLKYRDPRRFGALLYCAHNPLQHRLLQSLGPEPLSDEFDVTHLRSKCLHKNSSIKSVIMDSHIVTGVGNIYACEALFAAGINPTRKAGSISKKRLEKLVATIKATLSAAILQGGTTLQDFTQVDGKPGYFAQSLCVYGIKGPCNHCGATIRKLTQNQRSSYFCSTCQT
ncbi:MAG: formamidopyrimidine-DNA glycosylase [Gammaproteobacteria bacterium]|jgi:formamidopyrimidine-DNA glycosylase